MGRDTRKSDFLQGQIAEESRTSYREDVRLLSTIGLGKKADIYFFIKSNTTDVVALMPVRIVGSGRGAKRLE